MIPLELDLEVEIAEDVDLEVEAVTDTGNVRTQTKTATPSKAAQSVLPDEGFLLSGVDVDPIPDNFVDADDPETHYSGSYTVRPQPGEAVVLDTDGKILQEDIIVNEIPFLAVSNPQGGETVTIG